MRKIAKQINIIEPNLVTIYLMVTIILLVAGAACGGEENSASSLNTDSRSTPTPQPVVRSTSVPTPSPEVVRAFVEFTTNVQGIVDEKYGFTPEPFYIMDACWDIWLAFDDPDPSYRLEYISNSVEDAYQDLERGAFETNDIETINYSSISGAVLDALLMIGNNLTPYDESDDEWEELVGACQLYQDKALFKRAFPNDPWSNLD